MLSGVTLVAAEDTREARKILQSCGARARLISAHAHNERTASATVVSHLLDGQSCALVSDAGTPAISDPGARLVAAVHMAGLRVVPVPGPSAVTVLLSAAGFDADRFGAAADRYQFLGFLPARAGARRAVLESMRDYPGVTVLFEAPHRIEASLEALRSTLGDERTIAIGRELTKRFEQIVVTDTAGAVAWLASSADHRRGEFALAVAPRPVAAPDEAAPEVTTSHSLVNIEGEVGDLLETLLTELSPSRAAKLAGRLTGLPQSALYPLALEAGERLSDRRRRD